MKLAYSKSLHTDGAKPQSMNSNVKINEGINSPFIMPRKEVVIGVAAQDVQISGSMTGCHVGTTPSALPTDEGSPRFYFGVLISGAVFFWVLFFSLYKEKYLADKRQDRL